jgi:hypothetical protein
MDQLIQALHLHNWYAFAAIALTLLVQLIRTTPKLQDLWRKIPDGWRWLVPVVSGAATGFTQAYAANLPLVAALLGAIGGAVGISIPAMGINAFLTESPVRWNGSSGGLSPKPGAPTLPVIGFLGLLAILLVPSSCGLITPKTGTGGSDGGGLWPTIAHCAPNPGDLVGEVTQALLSGGDYQKALEDLAVRYGGDAVVCMVNRLVSDWSAPSAARNAIRTDALARGRAFLASVPTQVAP